MTVARWTDPNYTTQDAATYKAALDAAHKVAKRYADAFAPHQVYSSSPNPDLAVEIDAGFVFKGTQLTEVAVQTVTGFTIPAAGQHRVDRVVMDPMTGTCTRVAGTAATGSPTASAPAIPAGKVPICQVLITDSDTVILNSMITDERVFLGSDLLLKSDLVELLHVDYDTGHRDLAAARYDPAFFNQQWGGAPHYFEMVDGATGTPYRFEAATEYIETDTILNTANQASQTWKFTGFKVSKSGSYSAIWAKIYKVGNPTNNLQAYVLPDDGTGKPTGTTPITNGTATAQSGKLHSADTSGQWVRFVFPTPMSLTAGTQYHFVLKSSGAVDASNYWVWWAKSSKKYPHGYCGSGDGTPTWAGESGATTYAATILVEAPSDVASLQTGGLFSDGKIVFFEGASGVLNQSNGRVKDLKDFRGLDLTDLTLLVRGTAWTKDKTILEFQYGLDHDRIVLRSNVTTGYAQIDVYESDGTKHTVTGTTDVSTGDHDIMIRVRAKGDGSDAVSLYVDGSSQGTPVSSATISFDALFGLAQIGTFWIGGGFALAPTWTKDTAMGSLPSADGWTWTGTGTEANCMSVSGNKLYQNKNGYASADTGYYVKSSAGFSNANGWAICSRVRVTSGSNSKDDAPCGMQVQDGTKVYGFQFDEYFCQAVTNGLSGAASFYPQVDMKAAENVMLGVGKGSDALLFRNGRLIVDGTGNMTVANASNQALFGDVDASTGINTDAVWDYAKYYNTAWLPPQFTAGSLSELAIWTGDKTALASPLYNSGTFVSVKQYCGLRKNILEEVPQKVVVAGVTESPSTTSTAGTLVSEQEVFCIGSSLDIETEQRAQVNAISTFNFTIVIDGGSYKGGGPINITHTVPTSGYQSSVHSSSKLRLPFGLHKVEVRGISDSGANTLTFIGTDRVLSVEARA